MADRTAELKRRVGRLIAGEINTRDLDILFLWLRGRSFGNKAVADVGDFVAHSDERDKGQAWGGVQHFFNVARFLLPRVGETDKPVGTLESLKAAARSAFQLSSELEVRSAVGMSKSKAAKVLSGALEALESLEGRKLVSSRPLSPQETGVLTRYTSVLISRPAFSDTDLISELLICLARNRLIDHNPSEAPPEFSKLVALYAIEKMHRVRVRIEGGDHALLTAGIFAQDGQELLGVSATATVQRDDFDLPISFPIYMTSLDPRNCCALELLPPDKFTGTNWNFALEIGRDGKLQML